MMHDDPINPDSSRTDPQGDDTTQTIPTPASTVGDIGPYRILQRLGEGGMGEVWLAEQTEPIHRKVALKVIKAGMDTKQVVARFEVERQALALMDHPSIARVYEAGETPRGLPYFAMEYVRGEAITRYCDRQRLTTRDRLELFVLVCDGVQHAHQKGIIHRDLKPSNVLVTIQGERPVPKIIDFGVAKAIAQRLTERTVYTELGVMIGTPEYMSPEQAELSGLDIDTRTDVYALGVILYQILVGVLPFDTHGPGHAGFDEVRRLIREVVPPRPSLRVRTLGGGAKSRGTEPAHLASMLRGDLDWIVMKALEKDRTRRYGSPSDLAADIGRHLRYEPVLAGPPSALYRAGKFVRRHRFGVAAGATLALLLVGFAAAMAFQTEQLRRERDRAEKEAAKAKAVRSFLQDTLASADPFKGQGRDVTLVQALRAAVPKVDESLKDQPEVAAAVRLTIGITLDALGDFGAAEPLLRSALDARKQIFGSEHVDVAESLEALASLDLDRGEYRAAETQLRAALELRRRLQGRDHPDIAATLTELAEALWSNGDSVGAEERYREALEILRKSLGAEHPKNAKILDGLSQALVENGEVQEAEELGRKALEIATRALGDDHPNVAMYRNNLAKILVQTNRPDLFPEAEQLLRTSLGSSIKLLGEDHAYVGEVRHNLATVMQKRGDYAGAEAIYEQVLESHRRTLGEENPDVAMDLWSLAKVRGLEGDLTGSETLFRRTLAMQRKVLPETHPYRALALRQFSEVLRKEGKQMEAARLDLEATSIERHNKTPDK